MHDIKAIRENPSTFDEALARRGQAPLAAALIALDAARREALTGAQAIQAERNKLSREIGQRKAKGEDASDILAAVAHSKDEQAKAEAKASDIESQLNRRLAEIPNLPAADVPDGRDESANIETRRWREPAKFAFAPKDHVAIGEGLGMMDFERAAKMSGARFVVLTDALARLERALGAFMLDLQTGEHGYREVSPPILVRDQALFGTGQLPKFNDDLFETKILREQTLKQNVSANIFSLLITENLPEPIEQDLVSRLLAKNVSVTLTTQASKHAANTAVSVTNSAFEEFKNPENFEALWLIPTAEVPLTNLVRDDILEDATLPRRYTALTPCFRAEAGAAGKDTHGMIRQHQFHKVEMVSITTPEQSDAEHERMTGCAETVLRRLGLPYRVMTLCAGDMGFGARKTYDLEVWLPGQNRYREISSCSNCGDFQARRMNARFRAKGDKGTRFVHTLNGSGLAVGRALIAVLENYQQADGSVSVPEALRPYMGGLTVIIRQS